MFRELGQWTLQRLMEAEVQAFLEREITGEWPYLWPDAMYIKSRENGHVVTRAVVIAVGACL